MAERITDQQVADLIALLRTDAPVDVKVQHVTAVKSSIKQHTVPETCILPVFEALRTASSSQNSILVNAGFTALNHLFTRLVRQEPKQLAKEGVRTLPLIVEKLGDQKEKFRQVAQQALVTLYKVAPAEVERQIRNVAMTGKSARAKEASLHWLLQMHQEHGLQFRAYVPNLMELLEDADPVVRDAAKSTVIDLFKNAPNAAKSDLKKQLKIFKIRPAIEQAIIKELNPAPTSAPPSQTESLNESAAGPRPGFGASLPSLTNRPVTPGPTESNNAPETVEPSYVNTVRELDDLLREMHLYFEGKETEQNWLKREESITRLRRLLAGNAATDFPDQFLAGLRALLDGIIKAVVSLRTSLSKEGCNLVQDMARVYGPAIDPMVEILMQTFIKLTAATKKISSQLANATVDTIVERVTYSTRIMQHIWMACQDKNVQPRLYACGWLKTLLKKEAHHKNHIEHTGGVDLIEKCIKKGLADANPGVREKMRATYWTFAAIWPARAEAIMSGLDTTAARLLQNDPNNPKSSKRAEGGGGAVRPGLGLSKSTIGTSKPSVRDAMLAQKRAMTAKAMPPRPGSAMANLSPVRHTSSQPQTTTATGSRPRPESALLTSAGGISGAPVRPGRRRPETIARPATAGPYSVRGHDQPSTEQTSPPSHRPSRPKPVTPKSTNTSPKRPAPKVGRPLVYPTSGEPEVPTPPREGTPKSLVSPRATPSRNIVVPIFPPSSDTCMANEDLTLVVPNVTARYTSPPREPALMASALEREPPSVGSPGTPSRLPRPVGSSPSSSSQRLVLVDERIPRSPPRTVETTTTPVSPSPPRSLEVYEDPLTREQQTSPKPIFGPVLEDRPVNEDAALLQQAAQLEQQQKQQQQQQQHQKESQGAPTTAPTPFSPEKLKQLARLLDSGIAKIQQKSLDAHGFRRVQSILRDILRDSGSVPQQHHHPSTTLLTDAKFSALVTALFSFIEAPRSQLTFPSPTPERAVDAKAQALAAIRMLLRDDVSPPLLRVSFAPHVARGVESLVRARAGFDRNVHIVGGLEVVAKELCGLGDKAEIVNVLVGVLETLGENHHDEADEEEGDKSARSMGMGLAVLREVLEKPVASASALSPSSSLAAAAAAASPVSSREASSYYSPSDAELAALARLAARCFESPDSAVRMDAVHLCVALHARTGEARFWEAMKGVREDPKNLITYYIAREQREKGKTAGKAGRSGGMPLVG
ncbi:hypothetical protein VTJ49DRAFT_5877 [Mycothermus thermophilus]|uniref:TOG domain-containing protein n=1 Tax=Humicola insolens TaxID=85995 RepID=A0ABR3VJW8_HUMIN